MIRRIITIDEEKCNGCGLCADACHEGAIGIVDGKAKLLREDYCDGLGDCLPACPMNAISFEEGKHLPTMRQLFWRRRKPRKCRYPAVVTVLPARASPMLLLVRMCMSRAA